MKINNGIIKNLLIKDNAQIRKQTIAEDGSFSESTTIRKNDLKTLKENDRLSVTAHVIDIKKIKDGYYKNTQFFDKAGTVYLNNISVKDAKTIMEGVADQGHILVDVKGTLNVATGYHNPKTMPQLVKQKTFTHASDVSVKIFDITDVSIVEVENFSKIYDSISTLFQAGTRVSKIKTLDEIFVKNIATRFTSETETETYVINKQLTVNSELFQQTGETKKIREGTKAAKLVTNIITPAPQVTILTVEPGHGLNDKQLTKIGTILATIKRSEAKAFLDNSDENRFKTLRGQVEESKTTPIGKYILDLFTSIVENKDIASVLTTAVINRPWEVFTKTAAELDEAAVALQKAIPAEITKLEKFVIEPTQLEFGQADLKSGKTYSTKSALTVNLKSIIKTTSTKKFVKTFDESFSLFDIDSESLNFEDIEIEL